MQLLFRHIAAASWLSSVSRVFCADISLLSCYMCYLYAMLCSCRTISTKFNHPHLKGSANITSLRGRHASATKIRGHNLELKKSLPLVVDCLVIVEAFMGFILLQRYKRVVGNLCWLSGLPQQLLCSSHSEYCVDRESLQNPTAGH